MISPLAGCALFREAVLDPLGGAHLSGGGHLRKDPARKLDIGGDWGKWWVYPPESWDSFFQVTATCSRMANKHEESMFEQTYKHALHLCSNENETPEIWCCLSDLIPQS